MAVLLIGHSNIWVISVLVSVAYLFTQVEIFLVLGVMGDFQLKSGHFRYETVPSLNLLFGQASSDIALVEKALKLVLEDWFCFGLYWGRGPQYCWAVWELQLPTRPALTKPVRRRSHVWSLGKDGSLGLP